MPFQNGLVALWRCTACGYVYDETKEGAKFENLPADWRRPSAVRLRTGAPPHGTSGCGEKALQRPCAPPSLQQSPRAVSQRGAEPSGEAAARGLPNPVGFSVARCPVCGAEKGAFEKVEE